MADNRKKKKRPLTASIDKKTTALRQGIKDVAATEAFTGAKSKITSGVQSVLGTAKRGAQTVSGLGAQAVNRGRERIPGAKEKMAAARAKAATAAQAGLAQASAKKQAAADAITEQQRARTAASGPTAAQRANARLLGGEPPAYTDRRGAAGQPAPGASPENIAAAERRFKAENVGRRAGQAYNRAAGGLRAGARGAAGAAKGLAKASPLLFGEQAVNTLVDVEERGAGPALATAGSDVAETVGNIPAGLRQLYGDFKERPVATTVDVAADLGDAAFNTGAAVGNYAQSRFADDGAAKYRSLQEGSDQVLRDPFSRFVSQLRGPEEEAPAKIPGTQFDLPSSVTDLRSGNGREIPAPGTGFFQASTGSNTPLREQPGAIYDEDGNPIGTPSGERVDVGTERTGLDAATADRSFQTTRDFKTPGGRFAAGIVQNKLNQQRASRQDARDDASFKERLDTAKFGLDRSKFQQESQKAARAEEVAATKDSLKMVGDLLVARDDASGFSSSAEKDKYASDFNIIANQAHDTGYDFKNPASQAFGAIMSRVFRDLMSDTELWDIFTESDAEFSDLWEDLDEIEPNRQFQSEVYLSDEGNFMFDIKGDPKFAGEPEDIDNPQERQAAVEMARYNRRNRE